MRARKKKKALRLDCLKALNYQLKTISLFELIDTSTGINQLLLAREERMAVAANIYLHNVAVFRRTRFERSAARASHSHFVIFGMNISFHFFHLAVIFYQMLCNYNRIFFCRQLFLRYLRKIVANFPKIRYTVS